VYKTFFESLTIQIITKHHAFHFLFCRFGSSFIKLAEMTFYNTHRG
jgi:hypothetical protein